VLTKKGQASLLNTTIISGYR